jgi:UDP-N-acetylglucosamine diphosphorylase / glucose-1-phosphate thymidylyltransferase / UDP-N-acetylgalactosamine diphosphorylase / glucosamine-1-phosphate N-acetyltransferase / galactosamine-1-phosphate N-acetyltransferase
MRIKKAVILAAGKGTRMLPLTEKIPKVLVPINGKPFLHYLINNLKGAGFSEFGIIAGYKKEQIEKFIKENKINGVIIEQKEQLGTGHALMQAENFSVNEYFVVVNGDNLYSQNDLKKIAIDKNISHIASFHSETPEKYGVLISDEENNLLEIKEKPKEFHGNSVNIGLYKFTPEIFDELKKIKKSARGEYELTDAITLLAKQKKVKVQKIDDYWLDLGSIEDISGVEEKIKKLYLN